MDVFVRALLNRRALVAVAFSVFSAGCATPYVAEPALCAARLPSVLGQINVTQIVGKMAEGFCPSGAGPLNPLMTDGDVVVVPDYLDVASHATGLTGVVLGEVTRSSLSAVCGHKVRQIDLSKSVRLSADGIIGLTRDASRVVNREFVGRWGYIGTFAELPGKVIFTLRELDMESGATTKLISKEIVYGCRLESGRYRFEYSVY